MAAGADSIDDMDLLRHGATSTLFGGIRAPSTLGSHLRCYTWGNVAQSEKAGREFLAELARQAPLLPGAGTLGFIGFTRRSSQGIHNCRLGSADPPEVCVASGTCPSRRATLYQCRRY